MRRPIFLFSTSLLAISFGLIAHAATPIEISDFHISSVIPNNDALKPYCAMANRFDNGMIVTHSRNNFGLGSISFDFPNVEFDQGKNYQTTLEADSLTRRYAAIAAKPNLLIAKTGRDTALFNALNNGSPFSVELENGAISHFLKTSKQAFADFNDCVTGLEQTPPALVTSQEITPPVVKEPLLADEEVSITQPPLPIVAQPPLVTPPMAAKKEAAPIASKEKIIPLSQPVNPAQIGLKKTTRRHSIASSNLLFDNPDTARLAIPSSLASRKLIEPVIRNDSANLILDNPTTPSTKYVPASITKSVEPSVTPVVVEEPISEEAVATAKADLIEEKNHVPVIQEPVFKQEPILPTSALFETAQPQKTLSSPIISKPKKEEIITEKPAAVLTPPPVPVISQEKAVEPIEIVTPVIAKPIHEARVPSTPKTFIPPASPSMQTWTVKNIEKTDDVPSYCLISNRFENGMGLYATRSPNGDSTLGIDFGFEILEHNRQYDVTIEVDHSFNQKFIGQASDDVMMVVQMGQQDGFFNALNNGNALHISMPGAASTFDLDQVDNAYTRFTECLSAQNGTAIVKKTMPVIADPVINSQQLIQENNVEALKILPTHSLPTVGKKNKAPAPKTLETENPPLSNILTDAVKPLPSKLMPKQITGLDSNVSIDSILTAAKIDYSSVHTDSQDENILHWMSGDTVAGQFIETIKESNTTLLDRLMDDIDIIEQQCDGNFTSQIGIPEIYGLDTIANAETKCTVNGNSLSTAYIYQENSGTVKVWTQFGPSELGSKILNSRNKISGILQQRASFNAQQK